MASSHKSERPTERRGCSSCHPPTYRVNPRIWDRIVPRGRFLKVVETHEIIKFFPDGQYREPTPGVTEAPCHEAEWERMSERCPRSAQRGRAPASRFASAGDAWRSIDKAAFFAPGWQ
jgi:hypothetical protein